MNNSDLADMRRSRYGVSVSMPSVDQGFDDLQKRTGTEIARRESPLGFVDGAWAINHRQQISSEMVEFVPPGATIPIPAGSVVMVQGVQGDETWTCYLFVQEGQLRGPLVYAIATPSAGEIERVLLDPNQEDRSRLEHHLVLLLTISSGCIAIWGMAKLLPDHLGVLWNLALGLPLGAILSGFALAFVPSILKMRDSVIFHRVMEDLRQLNMRSTVPVELPDEAWRQCSQSELLTVPRGAVEASKPDLEISHALDRVRQSERKIEKTLPNHVGSLKRGVIKHSLSIIEDISKRAQRGGHLKKGSALKTAIREAITKAEAEMQRLEAEGRDLEQEDLMQQLRALRRQMDSYLRA